MTSWQTIARMPEVDHHVSEETHGEALVTDGGGRRGGGDEVNP